MSRFIETLLANSGDLVMTWPPRSGGKVIRERPRLSTLISDRCLVGRYDPASSRAY
jgi:hypothetical protein